ncbi:hypothetical protein EOE65_07690 [Neptunomonas marina]|uniref:Glycine-rich domain-containing protein-like n=2 Tax=Neptunomonas marina TaxID=1815562 RepID=A0A437Q8R4_9GAMM|nr:hypothetical protein EOE65_07690 [Neptunomonas marina]
MDTINTKVEKLDLSNIVKKVQEKTGMSERLVKRAESLYRQFLILHAKYPNNIIVPPHLADEMWHEHILSSRNYVDACNNLFGEYLHHHTDDTADVLSQGWKSSKELYASEFGVDLLELRQVASLCRV